MDYKKIVNTQNQTSVEISLSDYELVTNPLLNKGMAFTHQERKDFNLFGLLPPHEATLEEQRIRSYEAFQRKNNDVEKYIYLRDLQDSNEVLFYSLLYKHIEEMMPIVYTPTVGAGCQRFSHLYRRPRGLYLAYPDIDNIDTILANKRFDAVQAIVVSDGERILGLGDQGAGGMGIPIGKLALYTVCAGIHPAATLPILLDTGTNNPELIDDPMYIGWRHERIRGSEYDRFIDKFIAAVKKRFPHVLLQWEDFAQQNANPLLERYRNQLCTFNDDIQGTAAVATGTLFSAIQVTGEKLTDQRIAIVGAGSAGCGIAKLMMHAMIAEGLSETAARAKFYLIDRNGLLVDGMPGVLPFQQPFQQAKNIVATWQCSNKDNISLQDVVKNARPTVLVGVSGQPNIFNEAIVKEMAKNVARPVIFPLSNPTSRSEAAPTDLLAWTNGQAIIGTGSPFPNIMRDGKSFRVDQTNNAYIFPGMGLGLIAVEAKNVSDKMFMVAAKALAECSPAKNNVKGNLLPPFTQIREISLHIAKAVAQQAIDEKLAKPCDPDKLEKLISSKMWNPIYLSYKKVK